MWQRTRWLLAMCIFYFFRTESFCFVCICKYTFNKLDFSASLTACRCWQMKCSWNMPRSCKKYVFSSYEPSPFRCAASVSTSCLEQEEEMASLGMKVTSWEQPSRTADGTLGADGILAVSVSPADFEKHEMYLLSYCQQVSVAYSPTARTGVCASVQWQWAPQATQPQNPPL